jgi:hypothetical protein
MANFHEIKFYDARVESYVTERGTVVRSGAGWGAGPEYGVLYRLEDGRYLGGVRHTDACDLMTEIRYARNAETAKPARWK